MLKGVVQKIETIMDGSVKLSIYVNKEDINQAFPLAYKEVFIWDLLPPVTESEQFEAGKREGIRIAQEAFVKYCEEQLK